MDTTTTNASGFYSFPSLPAGQYGIHVQAPSGFGFTPRNRGSNDNKDSDVFPDTGTTACINLAHGQAKLHVDAGLVALAASCPDSTQAEPIELTLGDTVEGCSARKPDDEDWYEFDVVDGQYFTVIADKHSGTGVMCIYREDCPASVSGANGCGVSDIRDGDHRRDFRANATGKCLIKVGKNFSADSSQYDFTVRECTPRVPPDPALPCDDYDDWKNGAD